MRCMTKTQTDSSRLLRLPRTGSQTAAQMGCQTARAILAYQKETTMVLQDAFGTNWRGIAGAVLLTLVVVGVATTMAFSSVS